MLEDGPGPSRENHEEEEAGPGPIRENLAKEMVMVLYVVMDLICVIFDYYYLIQ